MRIALVLTVFILGLSGPATAAAQSEEPASSGEVVDRASVAPFLQSMLDQTQIANTALNVLHEQALSGSSNTSALTQPAWRQSTAVALAELRDSAAVLQSAPTPPPVLRPLAERLMQMGSDLDSGASLYGQALDTQDAVALGDGDAQLQAAAASLQPLLSELAAVAQTCPLDD